MLATGAVEAVAICDPSMEMREAAAIRSPAAAHVETLEELIAIGVDGVAIATPSALHATQAIRCLEAGAAVFCQKPLGRNGRETADVVAAASRANRLLTVDFSYRHSEGLRRIAELIQADALGHIFAIDLTFHNAYGPDKFWFYDRAQSGGGCLIDLGIHLVDLALWTMGFPQTTGPVSASLFRDGTTLASDGATEDYATANFSLDGGTAVRLACSWHLNAGQDARIEAAFYGTRGGAAFRNVNGSFYDFEAEHYRGTSTDKLTGPPDAWGGRAAAAWAIALASSQEFNADAFDYIASANLLDRMYT